MDLHLWKNAIFYFLKIGIFIVWKHFFCSRERRQTNLPCLFCLKTKRWKKNQFFDQNHGLIPLEKCIYFGFLKSMFFLI